MFFLQTESRSLGDFFVPSEILVFHSIPEAIFVIFFVSMFTASVFYHPTISVPYASYSESIYVESYPVVSCVYQGSSMGALVISPLNLYPR